MHYSIHRFLLRLIVTIADTLSGSPSLTQQTAYLNCLPPYLGKFKRQAPDMA